MNRLKRPESVLVVIYDTDLSVLVMQREDDPDFWQSVTGTLEPDEQPIQTAIREVQEETGIDVVKNRYQITDQQLTNRYPIRSQWRYRYPPEVTHNTEYVFSLQVSKGSSIILSEHLDYCWLNKHQAMLKVWSESNREAINRFV